MSPAPLLSSLVPSAALAATGAAQEPPYRLPGIGASRVVLEARVVDPRGRPLRGLGPADFRLRVDDRPVALDAVVWVAEGTAGGPGPAPSILPSPPALRSQGRLLVLLFQKDFERTRLRGLMRSLGQARALLEPLGARDRVAVLTYDSHLRLHLDFTNDLDAVRRTIDDSVLLRWPGPVPPGPPPSPAARGARAGGASGHPASTRTTSEFEIRRTAGNRARAHRSTSSQSAFSSPIGEGTAQSASVRAASASARVTPAPRTGGARR
jgi:hypothetical protein